MDTIGGRIAWIIQRDGLKKVEFAGKLGIHQSYVTQLIKGKNPPSDALVKLIASEFHVREEWLRDGTEPREEPTPGADNVSLDALVRENGLDGEEAEMVTRMVQMYFSLKPETRRNILAQFGVYFGRNDSASVSAQPEPKEKPWNRMTKEEKLAEVARQLDEEEESSGEEPQSGSLAAG